MYYVYSNLVFVLIYCSQNVYFVYSMYGYMFEHHSTWGTLVTEVFDAS